MTRIEVLDHGYIEAVESWGSEERIIEAARMSTGKGFLGWGPAERAHSCARGGDDRSPTDRCLACDQGAPGDEKLLRYLYENKHSTPFEMAGLVVEVQAPIFVFREWHRHRTQSFNEMSARYTPLPDLNYIPTVERLMVGSGGSNKQAGTVKGASPLTASRAELYREELRAMYGHQETMYRAALETGVPKEIARIHLPVGRYSRMRASANLRNWIAFLTLREASGAQWEIRMYANALARLVAERFPRTYALYAEDRARGGLNG